MYVVFLLLQVYRLKMNTHMFFFLLSRGDSFFSYTGRVSLVLHGFNFYTKNSNGHCHCMHTLSNHLPHIHTYIVYSVHMNMLWIMRIGGVEISDISWAHTFKGIVLPIFWRAATVFNRNSLAGAGSDWKGGGNSYNFPLEDFYLYCS